MQRQFNIQTETDTELQLNADEQAYYEAAQTADLDELQGEATWQLDDDPNDTINTAELHFLE